MVIMNILRMLVDVSFYGAFAGLIAKACGGSGAFAGILIQCICFGLSHLGGDRRLLRLAYLLPMALCWVIHRGSIADCILLIPTAAYIIWLVWLGDYALHDERQKLLFGVFWKALAVVLVFGSLLGGGKALAAVTVPYALMMLVCSVLLMRSLRHDPKVYCSPRYQLTNLSAVAVVAAVAGLLSTKAFLNGCAAVLKALYGALIQPVLEFLLNILLYIIAGIAALFSWLSLGKKELEQQEPPQMDLSGTENIFGEDVTLKEPGELLRVLGIILLAAAGVTVLVLFFRWLNRHRGEQSEQSTQEARENIEVSRRIPKQKETSPVRKIRAQYRGFLKWCGGLGIQAERSSTSQDIHRQVNMVSQHGETSAKIRELYIKARYAEEADRDDVRSMKQLCEQLKKPGRDA